MTGRRTGATIVGAFLLALSLMTEAGALDEELRLFPDITGWRGGETLSMELEAPSQVMGSRSERLYRRETDNHTIQVIMLKGPGTLWQGLPKGEISADDGPIGSGATFRTLEAGGYRAVMEDHPLTGKALVVEMAPDSTLTFETGFEDVDLERFAVVFLQQYQP